MGTRSDIIVLRKDGKWHRIYCHWDGYLEHNGKILFENYTSQAAVEKLVALGNLSTLGEKIGVKHPFEAPPLFIGRSSEINPANKAFKKKYGGMCLAYGRDRGEKNVAGQIGDKLFDVMPSEESWTEFTYIWCANPTVTDAQPSEQAKWWVGVPGESAQTFVDLGEALLGNKVVAGPVKAFGMVIGQHAKAEPGKGHGWHG